MSEGLKSKRAGGAVVAMCVLLYLVLGLARYDYGACLSDILSSESMDKGQAGFLGTVNFLSYAVGNALGGFLADRVRTRRLILIAVLLTGLSNLVFPAAGSYAVMIVAWSLNGLAQGPIFCSVMRLLNDFFPGERVTGPSIAVQCAFALGLSVAYAIAAVLIRLSGWRAVFLCAGACCLVFAPLWWSFIRRAEASQASLAIAPTASSAPLQPSGPSLTALQLVQRAGLSALPLALIAQGALRDGVSAWGPTYVGEVFAVGSALAIASNTVVPFASVAGIFAANLLKPRLGGNELTCAAVAFTVSAAAMGGLLAAAGWNLPLSVTMLAVSAGCMAGANAMLINAVPLQFGRFGRTGAVSGLLNTMVYGGSGASTYGIGVIVSALGWSAANLCWLALAGLAALCCFLAAPRWRRFKADNSLM